MNRLFYFIMFFLGGASVMAQTTITGRVTDVRNNPVPGANIFLKDTYDGTTSDSSGKYSFVTTETGEQVLSVSFLGFEKWEEKITLDSSTKTVRIRMKESVTELKTVTIAAGAFEASDEKKMVILRPLDIVTTAGANGDIYGALQTLPGTGVVGEKEGLYVRGGDASEARTFIDGLVVDNPYFSSVPDVPQRGRFSPFLFKGTSFSSGGYSAQYGQGMSSALILESQDLADKTTTNIGVMSVGANLGHTKRWKNSSLGVFGGYTNLTPYYAISKQNRDWEKAPEAINGSVIFRKKTSKTGMFKAFASYTWSDLSLNYTDLTDTLLERKIGYRVNTNNYFSNFSYKEIIFKTWTVYAAASLSANQDNIDVEEFPIENNNALFASRLTLSHSIGDLSVIRFGGEYQRPFEETSVPNFHQELNETYSAAYAEGDIYITPKLVTRLGIRGENSVLIDRINVAPRISLAYKTGKFSQVSLAYGDFYQVPDNQTVTFHPMVDFKYEKATHYILNFQTISDLRTFRIETYYKKYNDLIRNFNSSADNSGYGYSTGIDFFYRDKKTIQMADYWISYSYLDTKRLYKDFPKEAMPAYAANHTASLVFKYFFPTLSLASGMTYVYSSGRPYYNPNNPDYLSDRTKSYHNLSINFSYLTSIAKNFTVVVFSVSNILGIENIYSYNYSPDGLRRIPVGAPADRVFFAGVFINIGSQDDDSDKYN